MHFLFPSELFSSNRCDETFAEQRRALEDAGFTNSLISDSVLQEGSTLRGLPDGETVAYRGWMVTPTQYEAMERAVAAAGARLLTDSKQYRLAHYLPSWYPLIVELTPETRVFGLGEDLVSALRQLGWPRFFVKDYVKSLKTSMGAIIILPEEITALLEEMERFRGAIEGGVCIRRVEDFLPESERRYFVLHGRPYAADEDETVPEIVEVVALRIGSPFFSVDVVRRRDGALRIVEIGDGQVSDLVGWTAERFARMWRDASP